MAADLPATVIRVCIAALSPEERYAAMREWVRYSRNGLLTNKWFVLTACSVVFILTVVLIVIRRFRIDKQKITVRADFLIQAERSGLTDAQTEVLWIISEKAGLKDNRSIFTLPDVFEAVAEKFLQQRLSVNIQADKGRNVNDMLGQIRQKLGFNRNKGSAPGNSVITRPDSRSIRPGSRVSIAPADGSVLSRVDAVVVRNDESGFVLRPQLSVNTKTGRTWNVIYSFGQAVWTFDAVTILSSEAEIVMSHAANVRFVNRRRFLRVPVRLPALTAYYPSIKKDAVFAAPQFVEGTITELSGPGLKIRTDMTVTAGERILVVFEHERGMVVQGTALVRRANEGLAGRAIGVELAGLSAGDEALLMTATNRAAVNRRLSEFAEENEPVMTGGHR